MTWGCRIFGHKPVFQSDGEIMRWECQRGCRDAGSKTYPSADHAQRYAEAFNEPDDLWASGHRCSASCRYGSGAGCVDSSRPRNGGQAFLQVRLGRRDKRSFELPSASATRNSALTWRDSVDQRSLVSPVSCPSLQV